MSGPATKPADDLAEALAVIRWLTEEGSGFGEFECGHGHGVLSRRCDAKGCMGARVYDLMQRLSPRSPRRDTAGRKGVNRE